MKVDRKVVAVLVGAALLVALVVTLSFRSFSHIEDAAAARTHSQDVLNRADDLLSALKDAETGGRGFVLTGDEAFLEPYFAVRNRVAGQLKELRQLTLLPAAQKYLDAIAPLVDARLAELKKMIEFRRNGDVAAATAIVSSGVGQRLMNSIRAEMGGFVRLQEDMSAQRDAAFQSTMRGMFITIVVASAFTLLFALSFAYLIYRESRHRLQELVHRETQDLLATQEKLNEQLHDVNATLQVSEERLAVTLNSIGDAVIATDAEGRVTLLNPLAILLTGWTLAEATGRPVEEIFHIINEETRQPSVIPVKAALAQGTIQGLANHTVLIARNGSECAIADSCAPIRERDGQVVGAVLVFRDVTDSRHLEQALQEKNVELESARTLADKANLAKSDFLSSMSHELRTPLSAILGFAQLLDADSSPPSASQKKSIEQILKAGWYLLELINEILDLAVIESGKLSLSMEPVLLADVIRECQTMIEPMAQKRGIGVTFPKFAEPYFVKVDRTRIKQVLINLLSNVIKYNRAGGSVNVECVVSGPQRVRISVRDTGAGLSPEKMAQLFQPFNRLGQEATTEQGTGIGLVMCKRLSELMGSVMGVESDVGKGSVFWIELNLTAETQSPAKAAESATVAPAQMHAGMKIHTLLYVEDNPANLLLVEAIIERRPDIRLLTAQDGNRGVELARASLPDVILMDINLPGISGIEALGILATDPTTAHIPVLALSANAMPRDIEKGMEAGFFRYLTKPIMVVELLDSIDAALKFAKGNHDQGQPAALLDKTG
ncbi:MAG: CHASE3 domain-containing protein [Burkholderiales bacterium]|nr:CHASE3 domain-containing protein [Burkholderiales bacterium]